MITYRITPQAFKMAENAVPAIDSPEGQPIDRWLDLIAVGRAVAAIAESGTQVWFHPTEPTAYILYQSGEKRELDLSVKPWTVYNLDDNWERVAPNPWRQWAKEELPAINQRREEYGDPPWRLPTASKHSFQVWFELGQRVSLPRQGNEVHPLAIEAIAKGIQKVWDENPRYIEGVDPCLSEFE